MKCMYVMQCKSQKQKQKNSKGQEGQSNEVQGPCQKDSIRLSLLHSKLLRCHTSIVVLIHMGMISNSRIGIKVQSLYQFTNEYHMILCLRHKYFWFVCTLSSQQLETVWTNVPRLSTKMRNPCKLIMCLALRRVRSLRFRLMKINPNLPRRCNFYRFSLTHSGFDDLTHRGFERREGTKFVDGVQTQRCFLQSLSQFCQRETFEHLECDQVRSLQTYQLFSSNRQFMF